MEKLTKLFTIGRYFKDTFGEKTYKVPINLSGFTCPNIDGTVAKGGCVFCENDSFSPNLKKEKTNTFKLSPTSEENPYLQTQIKQMKMQFDATKKVLSKKFGAKKFIVYFQSFTNTYAPLKTIKALYEEALTYDDVVGISIGTRTDSITDEILDYLQELNTRKLPDNLAQNSTRKTYEIWVEYGIQSIYDKTLERINRGHDFENVKLWIEKTKAKDLLVCGHMIFGLPDETQEMMLEGVKVSLGLGIDSIKFHPLYVVKNTLLTNDYINKKFAPITEELYIDTLVKAIKMLPKNVSVSRVTAGINDDTLLSPMWCKNKHEQMYKIKQALLVENILF